MAWMKKKMIGSILTTALFLVLIAGTIVAVLASNSIIVNSNVSVQYDSTINANVSANYWLDNAGGKTNFIPDQPISIQTTGSPSAISLNETDRYVIFEYIFTNNMQNLDAYGNLTYADDLDNDDTNIIVGYYISDTEVQVSEIESKTFDESHVEGICLGNVKLTKNAKTYVYIKARIDKLENDGEFSGTYHWDFAYDMFATDQAFFEFDGNTLTKYLGGAGDTVVVPSSYTPASATVSHMSASNVEDNRVQVTKIANGAFDDNNYGDVENKYGESSDDSIEYLYLPQSITVLEDCFAGSFHNHIIVYYLGTIEQWILMDNATMGSYENYFYRGLYIDGKSFKTISEITIPEGITEITAAKFFGWSGLQSVNLPSTLKTIGSYAFASTTFQTIEIPNGVETIGSGAFYNTKLTQVEVPSSVKTIGSSAFNGSTELERVVIASGVEEIGQRAFVNCSKLSDVTLPNTLTSLANDAFSGCAGISVVDGATYFGSASNPYQVLIAHENPYDLYEFTIPSSTMFICDYALFEHSIENLVIPSSVIYIGDSGLFSSWGNTYSLTFEINSQLRYVGGYGFCSLCCVESLTLPNSLEIIEDYAFNSVGYFDEVIIPDSVKKIGYFAFGGNEITSFVLPEGSTWAWVDYENQTAEPVALTQAEMDPTTLADNLMNNSEWEYRILIRTDI